MTGHIRKVKKKKKEKVYCSLNFLTNQPAENVTPSPVLHGNIAS